MKKYQLKNIIKEVIKESLNEQRDICSQLQTTNPNLFNYCYSHCQMNISSLPPECPNNFETCCPEIEEGCPEGMIDQDHPSWGDCVKCWTNGIETTITGENCECCRPMDNEPEEKFICYKCQKKGGNKVISMSFPNNLSSWSWFNFQGECPKGWTTDSNPCN